MSTSSDPRDPCSTVPDSSVAPKTLVGFPTDPAASYNPMRSIAETPDSEVLPPDGLLATGGAHELREEPVDRTLSVQEPPRLDSSDSAETIEPVRTLDDDLWGVRPTDTMSFSLTRLVGEGSFGEVWEATQTSLGRTVAVKRLRASRLSDRRKVRALELEFRQEAFTTARLDHPNIVPVHEVGFDDQGRLMIAMKLVRGRPWKSMLDEDFQKVTVQDFLGRHLPILIDVAQAVAFAHSRHIVHRDLKPQQVMVGKFGEVMLMDWGLAMMFGTPEEIAGLPQASSQVIPLPAITPTNPAGTPAFMAPEQTDRTTDRIGPWTDVYLLGGILFYLLTQTYPHFSSDAEIAFLLAKEGNVGRPEERNPRREVPAELSDLCMAAMERDISKRMKSAEEFIARLQEYLSGSGRRHESNRLAQAAGEKLRGAEGRYEVLSECSMLLAQSLGLWPESPLAGELRQEVLEAFARAALSKNDLLLARIQAERLPNREKRDELIADINAREEKILTNARKPPLFTLGRLLVLAVAELIAMAAIYLMLHAARGTVMDESRAKVRDLAVVVAAQIDPQDLAAINSITDKDSPEFSRVLGILQRVKNSFADIRFVYTMRRHPGGDPSKLAFIVDAQPWDVDLNGDGRIEGDEKGSPPGLEYDATESRIREGLIDAFAEETFYSDPWGTFLSAYAPIRDPESGKAVALLGIDVTAAAIRDKMRSIDLAGGAAAIIIAMLVACALIASFSQMRTMKINELLDEQLRHQGGQLSGKNISLT